VKLIIPKSNPTENGLELVDKSWREGCARLLEFGVDLHLSDIWDLGATRVHL